MLNLSSSLQSLELHHLFQVSCIGRYKGRPHFYKSVFLVPMNDSMIIDWYKCSTASASNTLGHKVPKKSRSHAPFLKGRVYAQEFESFLVSVRPYPVGVGDEESDELPLVCEGSETQTRGSKLPRIEELHTIFGWKRSCHNGQDSIEVGSIQGT